MRRVVRGFNAAALHLFRQAVERRDQLVLSLIVEFEPVYGVANSDRRRQAENSVRLHFLGYPFERLLFFIKTATEMAFHNMSGFLVTDKCLSRVDAYAPISVNVDITQLVDGKAGVHAMCRRAISLVRAEAALADIIGSSRSTCP